MQIVHSSNPSPVPLDVVGNVALEALQIQDKEKVLVLQHRGPGPLVERLENFLTNIFDEADSLAKVTERVHQLLQGVVVRRIARILLVQGNAHLREAACEQVVHQMDHFLLPRRVL
jgi:hypothetical protein